MLHFQILATWNFSTNHDIVQIFSSSNRSLILRREVLEQWNVALIKCWKTDSPSSDFSFFNTKKSYINDLEKYAKFWLIASTYIPNLVLPMCGRDQLNSIQWSSAWHQACWWATTVVCPLPCDTQFLKVDIVWHFFCVEKIYIVWSQCFYEL